MENSGGVGGVTFFYLKKRWVIFVGSPEFTFLLGKAVRGLAMSEVMTNASTSAVTTMSSGETYRTMYTVQFLL